MTLLGSRLVEKTGEGVTMYYAAQEEGVSMREIAETIGKGLKVPVVSSASKKRLSTLDGWRTLRGPICLASSDDARRITDRRSSNCGLRLSPGIFPECNETI